MCVVCVLGATLEMEQIWKVFVRLCARLARLTRFKINCDVYFGLVAGWWLLQCGDDMVAHTDRRFIFVRSIFEFEFLNY